MAPAHRSPRRWLTDLIKSTKRSANILVSKLARRTAFGAAEPTSEQPPDFEHPRRSAEHEEQPDTTVSGNYLSGAQTRISTNSEKGPASENRRVATDSGAASLIDNVEEDQTTNAAKNAPGGARPTGTGILQVSSGDDESPIWLNSIERFKKEYPKDYKLMEDELHEIRNLKEGDTWDTWINRRGLDKASKEMKYKWLRECKAYMPSLATVRVLAQNLGNLDPYKIAPLVTAGVFLFVELCFGSMDPFTCDKAMGLLLKTNIVISRWVSREGDLRWMKSSDKPFMESENKKVDRIQKGLGALYFDSLVLMSSIYQAGRSRSSRFVANSVSRFPEWERIYKDIELRDSEYGELRSEVESRLKNCEENFKVLDWIGNRKEDPEPLHQTVKKRTGVDDPSSKGGYWFLQSPKFTSWVDGIRYTTARDRVFWLKGSMGTGKTTLLCRVISHFENSPIGGVKFVSYYCHGSGSGLGPTYKTILRALCRRLAWKSNGSVAEPAMLLYHSLKFDPEAQITEKTTWEKLLRDLIASSSIKVVFVLDGLDECESLGDYIDLLKFLTDLPPQRNGPFFLVSSQPHVPVWKYFDRSVHIFDVVQDETKNEMEAFIETQINSKKAVHWEESIFFQKPEMLEELRSALLVSAGGMFRWVEIWIGMFFPRNKNAVRRQGNAQKLLDELKNFKSLAVLPRDENDNSRDDKKKMALTEAYEKLWRINGDYGEDKDLQTRLFQIITASFENLTPHAILEAVCFDPSEPPDHYEELNSDHIAGLYSGFLKVDGEGRLEYEHLSAKTFVGEIMDSDKTPFSSEESHRKMAEIAICAIERPSHRIWIDANIDLVGQGPSPRASHSGFALENSHQFGPYIFRFWLQHCQILRQEKAFIQQMSNLFQRSHPALQGWLIRQVEDRELRRDTLTRPPDHEVEAVRISPFLCMVSFGFSPFSRDSDQPHLLPGFEDPTVRTLDDKTALQVACETSNTALVEDLLKLECMRRGSCFELMKMKDDQGRTALHFVRKPDVAKILLQYEIRERRESSVSATTSGPIHSHLLRIRDNNDFMAIENLVVVTGEDFIRWILQSSMVDPKTLGCLHRRALTNDNIGLRMIKLFLEHGADPNVKMYESGGSPWEYAVNSKQLPLAKLLFDHGAHFDKGVALHALPYAVRTGNLESLQCLCSMGVDFNTRLTSGTALGLAINSNRLGVIEYLLSQGADVHAPHGLSGTTFLHRVAATGNIDIAELLLDHQADINLDMSDRDSRFPKFSTPLAAAVRRGKWEMADYLRGRGADATFLSTSDKEALDTMAQR